MRWLLAMRQQARSVEPVLPLNRLSLVRRLRSWLMMILWFQQPLPNMTEGSCSKDLISPYFTTGIAVTRTYQMSRHWWPVNCHHLIMQSVQALCRGYGDTAKRLVVHPKPPSMLHIPVLGIFRRL